MTIAVFTGLSDELEELVYDKGIECVEGNLRNVNCVYGGRGRKEVMLNCSVIVNSSRKYTFTVTGIIHIHRQSAYQVLLLLNNPSSQQEPGFISSLVAAVVICNGAIIVAVTLTFCRFFVLSKTEVKKEHTVCPAAERM